MKFYPRLGIFKNSTGVNTFDGTRAFSYDWYCYALKLADGRWAVVETAYSNTTGKHISEWFSLTGVRWDSVVRVHAPRGLTDTQAMRDGIAYEQNKLREEMARKGAHKTTNARRLQRIADLEAMLDVVTLIEQPQREVA